jgi:hypothetical protein
MTPVALGTGHELLYTLTLPDGRTVGVYGDAATWRQSAAKLLLDAGKMMAVRRPLPEFNRAAPVVITQE